MSDIKYRTPNGQIVSASDLQAKYGDKFNSLVENNTFSEVKEPVYKTPNGKFEVESILKEKYGNEFQNLISNNTFVLDSEEPLKKKEQAQLPMEENVSDITESPSESTSLGSPKPFDKNALLSKGLKQASISNPLENAPVKQQKVLTDADRLDVSGNYKKLNERLSSVDDKLINNNEEYVVPELNYKFGDLGFKFEESGATGDYMKVTSPDGKEIEVSLDPTSNTTAKGEAKKLRQFINTNTPQSGLSKIEKDFKEGNMKFSSEKDIDLSIKSISDEANTLNTNLKTFLSEKARLDVLDENTEEYLALQKKLIADRESILSKQELLQNRQKGLEKAVGKYSDMKAQQGTVGGWTTNTFLSGASSISANYGNVVTDIMAEIMPNEWQRSPEELKKAAIGFSEELGLKPPTKNQTYAQWKSTLTEDQQDEVEDKLDDIAKKTVKKDIIPSLRKGNVELFGDAGTTAQFAALREEGFWGGAFAGVVRSLPAMIGGAGPVGWAQRTSQFYAQTSDAVMQEMEKNPEFNNISENEKLSVVLPIGVVGAVLEEFGLRNLKASQGIINKLTLSILGKAGMKIGAKSFRELVENEISSKIARGLLTVSAAGLAEAETGAAQQAAEYVVKDIYNAVKDKELFKTPETAGEWISDVVRAGAQEAVGGFVLGVPTAVSVAYSGKGFLKMDNASFALFEAAANDENIQKAFITSLKSKITQGELTTEEAKEQLNNYRNSVGLFRSLPEGLDMKQKKEAMNLLKEKKDLETQIDGKDASLVKKQKARITAIDEELTALSEADVEVGPEQEESVVPMVSKILATPESTTTALEALSTDEKVNTTYIGPDGTVSPIIGNEKTLANLFQEAKLVPEEERTESQQSIIDAVEVSLKTPLDLESEVARLQDEFPMSEAEKEINKLNDNEDYVRTANSLDEVPVEFRDRVKESTNTMGGTARKTFFGIPYGKETKITFPKTYTYTATGQELKNSLDNAIKTKRQAAVAPTTDTGVSASSNNNISPWVSNDIKDYIDYHETKAKEAQEKEKKKGIGKKILDFGGLRSWEKYVTKFHQKKVRLLKENPLRYYQEELSASEKIKEKTEDDQDHIEWVKQIISELEKSKSNTNKSSLSNIKGKQTDAVKIKVIESAERAVKTLKSIFPNFDMIVHEDEGSYNAAVQKEKGELGTSGNFSVRRNAEGKIVGGRIDINLSKATTTTVAHEVAHSVLLHAFGDNPKLFKSFRDKISKIVSEDNNKKLMEFTDQYTNKEVQPEEYLVQLTALMEQEKENISTTTYQKIAALINNFVSTITAGQIKVFEDVKNTKDLIDFLNTTSKAIRGGEEITTKGAEVNDLGLNGIIDASNAVKSKSSIDKGVIKRFNTNKNTKVVENTPLSNFNKKRINLMESDRMTGGYISDKGGNPIFKFFGGVYFPIITGKWWASMNDVTANKITNACNSNRDADGYIYSGPMVGSDKQHMSNNDMLTATFELMRTDVKKKNSDINKKDFIKQLQKAFNKKGLVPKKEVLDYILNRKTSVSTLFNEIDFIFSQNIGSIKNKSGEFILDSKGKKIPTLTFLERLDIVDGLLGNKTIVDNMFPTAGSMSDAAKRFEEPITSKANKIGDLVTVMRTKGTLKWKQSDINDEFYHKSYPFEIYAENEDGTPAEIEVYILDGAYPLRDVLPVLKQSVSGKIYTWQEYLETHGPVSEKLAEAQYARTSKNSAASGEINIKTNDKEVGTPTSKSQKLDNEYAESSGTTQRNNTIPSYIRAAEKLKSLGVKGSVLDYGAGLGLGSDAMNEVLGKNVDSYEINPEKWEGKAKVKYTNVKDINKKYDAIVSLNVVNVVPKDVRDFIIKDIFNHLKDGGTAIISSRAFSNDIANSKKFKVAKEEKAYIINQKEKGKAVNVYQKGYDGDEFFDYVKDLLGDKARIKKVDSEYGKKGVIIRKISEVSSGTPTSKSQVEAPKTKITLSNKFTNLEGAENAVNEIKELGEVNQLNDKQVVINGVKINVERDGGKILLKEITSIEQGKGAGTKVLKQIQEVANENDIDIVLSPTKIKNTSEEQLNKWYKNNGFEDYTQGRLIYKAKSKEKVASEVKELEQSFPLSKSQVDVWHGSPYSFDKFTTEKIGTGEGAQAFGWGLYFTDLKDIAENYAKKLSKIFVDGKTLEDYLYDEGVKLYNIDFSKINSQSTKNNALNEIDRQIKENQKDIDYYENLIDEGVETGETQVQIDFYKYKLDNLIYNDKSLHDAYNAIFRSKKYEADENTRNLYKVSLHEGKTPDQYTWLEWDKPLSEKQKEKIINQIEKENSNPEKTPFTSSTSFLTEKINSTKKGGQLYAELTNLIYGDKNASEFLLRSGIDGIKYPAESIARGVTSDTARGSNYVVFDENAVTINTVSKAQQGAVNAINKIIKDARGQGFSEEAIKTFLESKGLTSQEATEAMAAETSASKKIVLSEETMPGYDRMMEQVDGIIEKSEARGVDKAKTLQNVINYVQGSKVYENATDVQREKLMRDINKMFGKSEKSSNNKSFFDKLTNIADQKTITRTDYEDMVEAIKIYERGSKSAKAAWVGVSKQLTKDIKALVGTGKITVKQAANVLRRFSAVNVFSEKSIGRFVDYMTKVFADAEYANQISIANKTRKAISALSRNDTKNANLRVLGKQFSELDPSLIEDIYTYNQNASELKKALEGSKVASGSLKLVDTVDIPSFSEYINAEKKIQDKILEEERIAEAKEIMGEDISNLTDEEIKDLLEQQEDIKKKKKADIKDSIKNVFEIYSTLIKETISSGLDVFTGEPRTFTEKEKNLIGRFMDMNLDNLNSKEALAAYDSLVNFFQNNSTAKMEAVLSEYTGKENARKLVEKGIKSIPLSKWFMKSFGRGLAKHTYNLNILFERMFKGVNSGAYVEKMSGVTNLINKKAYAQAKANAITAMYVAEFFEQKANGETFNTSANNAERGISAFLQRNVIGTEEEIAEDFERRKELVEKTIDELSQGTDDEQKKSEIYEEAYEKFKKAKNVQDVINATDKVNLKAIQFWQNKWAENYEQLADVSLNVYNKVLERDTNYTPDKFVRLMINAKEVDLLNNESSFHANNGTLYKKEAGSLQKAIKPDAKSTDNVMDFSFDKNNANSMYDALIDVNTAAAIRQVEAFLKSDDFKKVFGADDGKVLIQRINLYVKNIRKKNNYSEDGLNKLVKALNKISAIGVSQALAGPSQTIKQIGPVMLNTLINAGAVDLKSSLEVDFLDFLKNSGYAIAIRGAESQGSIDSLNKIIKEESKGKVNKSVDYVMKKNEQMLKLFLVRPDVFIARASWKSYYEKALTKQGINVKGLDYSKHQVNEDAANYAQKMVDRQQNVSDADLAGNLFTDKSASNQILMKIFMPFASFRMNQAARLGSDLNVLTSPLSTTEDKKIAALSLTGFSVEMVAFKMLSTAIGVLLSDFTKWLMDDDEEDEEREKRINDIIKGQTTSTINDVLSPLPVLDPFVQYGASYLTEEVQDILETEEEDRVSLFEPKEKNVIEQFGLFGIPFSRAIQLGEMTMLAYDGTFKDNYKRERQITEENQDLLKKMIPLALVTTLVGPVEANTVVRNTIKYAKKNSDTISGGTTSPSKSKRESSSDEDSYKKKELTKTEMKKYNPEKYEIMYGEGSPEYYKDELLKDKAQILAEKRKQLLEDRYGY